MWGDREGSVRIYVVKVLFNKTGRGNSFST